MESVISVPIKEEPEDEYLVAEGYSSAFECNVKIEPKPEIPLLVLHSLPNVVAANPVEGDDINNLNGNGLTSGLEISYKPGPKSRKKRQFSTLANFQILQKAPLVASGDDEETKPSLQNQYLDLKVAYKRFIPDSEEQGETVNLNVMHIKQDSESETKLIFQEPRKPKRGRRKGMNVCRSQQNSKRKKKVKEDTTKNTQKQKPKKEAKSGLNKKDSKVASNDSKVARSCKPRLPSPKKANNESISGSNSKGKHTKTGKRKVMLCEYCSAVFTRLDYLKIHMMLHTNERPYQCDICQKGFRMRWQVGLHRKIHSNEKPHKCQFCSYCSIRKDALRTHCRNVHKNRRVCDINDCLLEHVH